MVAGRLPCRRISRKQCQPDRSNFVYFRRDGSSVFSGHRLVTYVQRPVRIMKKKTVTFYVYACFTDVPGKACSSIIFNIKRGTSARRFAYKKIFFKYFPYIFSNFYV